MYPIPLKFITEHKESPESFWIAKGTELSFLGQRELKYAEDSGFKGIKRFLPSLLGVFQCERVFENICKIVKGDLCNFHNISCF